MKSRWNRHNQNNTLPRPHTRPATASTSLNASRRLAASAAAPKQKEDQGSPSPHCHHNPNDQCKVKLTSQSPPSQPSASVLTRLLTLSIALYNVMRCRVIATSPSTTSHPPLSDWPWTEAATRVIKQGLTLSKRPKSRPPGRSKQGTDSFQMQTEHAPRTMGVPR